jgi:hypothetical protein
VLGDEVGQGALGVLTHAQGLCHDLHHETRLRQRGQLAQPGPVRVRTLTGHGHLEREAALAGATHAGEGDQPAALEQQPDVGQLPLPADEPSELGG